MIAPGEGSGNPLQYSGLKNDMVEEPQFGGCPDLRLNQTFHHLSQRGGNFPQSYPNRLRIPLGEGGHRLDGRQWGHSHPPGVLSFLLGEDLSQYVSYLDVGVYFGYYVTEYIEITSLKKLKNRFFWHDS